MYINHPEQIVLISFLASLLMCLLFEYLIGVLYNNYIFYVRWVHLINYGVSSLFMKHNLKLFFYQISIRAFFLGYSFSLGMLLYISSPQSWKVFGLYTTILPIFHLTEYLAVAFTNPTALTVDTFIINHSKEYTVAAILSWLEFMLEICFFPYIKKTLWISCIGIILCAFGEIIRKAAIFTAKKNFNHIVQSAKAYNHKLVTHGIYNICRHPSYVGWFYWSIGTQVFPADSTAVWPRYPLHCASLSKLESVRARMTKLKSIK